jgi:hypothetical protein
MIKLALIGAACLLLSAVAAAAAPPLPAGTGLAQSAAESVQLVCRKGSHYSYCRSRVTGRIYRGCCRI